MFKQDIAILVRWIMPLSLIMRKTASVSHISITACTHIPPSLVYVDSLPNEWAFWSSYWFTCSCHNLRNVIIYRQIIDLWAIIILIRTILFLCRRCRHRCFWMYSLIKITLLSSFVTCIWSNFMVIKFLEFSYLLFLDFRRNL